MSLRLDDQLCFALYSAQRAVTAAYGPLLAPLGLTYPQYLVMLVLWEEGEASVKHLGERLALDSGTLTPLVKRLEAQGLVAKARSTEDERVVVVSLTSTGKRLKKRAEGVPKALVCAMGDGMPDLVRLRDALKELAQVARAANTCGPADRE